MTPLKTICMNCKKLFNQVQEHYWGKQFHLLIYKTETEEALAKKIMALPWEGKGSLMELDISVANGHMVSGRQEDEMNALWHQLRRELYHTAKFIAGPQ